MTVTWNVVGRNFAHKTGGHTGRCSTHGKVPRHVRWSFEDEGDVTFYLDRKMAAGLTDGRGGTKFGWALESRAILPHVTEQLKQRYREYLDTYRVIFTHNQELLALDDRFRFAICHGSWIHDTGVHPKRKRISAINSGKVFCEGHRRRNAFIERYRDRFDLFGNKYHHLPRKELGLNDYMFSVAIENGSYASYFTEKILDCFATGTIPIYWGAPDIGDFFNADGIVPLDDDFDFDAVTPELYRSKLDAVHDNFERVKRIHTAEDWIYLTYRDELFEGDRASQG